MFQRSLLIISMVALASSAWTTIPTWAGEDDACCKDARKMQCSTCLLTCQKTMAYCKKKGGKHGEKKHLQVLRDCITMCRTTTELGANGSALLAKASEVCAEACKRCAESCEKFDDKVMKDCAAECRQCSASCKSAEGCHSEKK